MNLLAFLYVFALFYVFIPGTVITLPIKGSKMIHSLVHALLFSIVLFFTYSTVFQFSLKEGAGYTDNTTKRGDGYINNGDVTVDIKGISTDAN